MKTTVETSTLKTFAMRMAALRILFGIVWVVDAALKFQPSFYNGILQLIKSKDAGEPGWLNPWFHAWYHIVGSNPHLFAVIIIVAEILTAVSLLLGVARRLNYALGAVLSFLIWSVGEGFGGPYVAGTTDINAAFIYAIVFLLLYAGDSLSAPAWSLEPYIHKWWAGRHQLVAGSLQPTHSVE